MDAFERVSTTLLAVETLDNEEFLEIVNNNATIDDIREIQNKKVLSGKNDNNNTTSPNQDVNSDSPKSTVSNVNTTTPTPA
jgi:hypothetical protein